MDRAPGFSAAPDEDLCMKNNSVGGFVGGSIDGGLCFFTAISNSSLLIANLAPQSMGY